MHLPQRALGICIQAVQTQAETQPAFGPDQGEGGAFAERVHGQEMPATRARRKGAAVGGMARVQSHVADQAPAFGGPDHPADLERELPGHRVLDIGGTMLRASTSLERQHQDAGRRIGEQPIVQMIHRQGDGFLHRHRRRFLIAGIIDAIVDRRSASDTAAQQHPS